MKINDCAPPKPKLSYQKFIIFQAFSNAPSWTSFFRLLMLPGAKMLDLGSPLAPSWCQNGTQNRTSGANNLNFIGSLSAFFGNLEPRATPEFSFGYFSEKCAKLGAICAPAGRRGDPKITLFGPKSAQNLKKIHPE